MSNSSIRTKQIYFIDSAVPDRATIVASLPPESTFYLLDANQDGLQQMADILSGYSGLDAIHVISHGSPGSLQLGSGLVTQTTLNDHSAALSSIGNALTETGDLLLYGCDVAQGDVGQAFVQQLATATGADVAASDDLTGNTALGGDWVLESQVGSIQTTSLSLPELSSTLGTTETLNFLVNDASLWRDGSGFSFNHTFDQLVFALDPISTNGAPSADILGSTLGLDYALNVSDIQFGLPITVGLSSGAFDLSYPVDAQIGLPSQVKYGDTFTVHTSPGVATSPSMVIDGPSVEMSLDAIFKANVAGHMGLTWDLPGSDPDAVAIWGNVDENNVFSNSSLEIDQTVGLYDLTLDTSDLDWVWNQNGNITKSTQGGRFVYHNPFFTIGSDIDLNGLDGTASVLTPEGNTLTDFSISLHQDDPMFYVDLDVDDIVGTALSAVNPAVGELISRLDNEYRTKLSVFGRDLGTEYDAGLLSFKLMAGVSPALKVDFDVQDIGINLTATTGETLSGLLGDTFNFDSPTTGSMSITSSYLLNGSVTVTPGLFFNVGYEAKIIGAEGAVFGLDIPKFFDDGESSYVFSPSGDFFTTEYYPNFLSISHPVSFDLSGQSYSLAWGDSTIDTSVSTPHMPTSLSVSIIGADRVEQQGVSVMGEGNDGTRSITFSVTRSGDLSASTQANYSFTLGNGIDADDFVGGVPTNGSLTFAEGESTKNVTLSIIGDLTAEADERLTFNLTSSARVDTPATTLVIQSDDGLLITGSGEIFGTVRNDVILGATQADYIYAGPGNDSIDADSGDNWVDGGAGFDSLTVDASSLNGSSYAIWTYTVTQAIGNTQGFIANANFDELRNALASSDATLTLNNGLGSLSWKNIERLNLTAIDNFTNYYGYDDLLIFQGSGGCYHGGTQAAYDTFYADWSGASNAITWANDPSQTQTANGVEVSGLERLLLTTGSGDDVLSNTNVNTNDVFITGAGNDTIDAGGGDDSLNGGSGNDTLMGGSGTDTYRFDANWGIDTISDDDAAGTIIFNGIAESAVSQTNVAGDLVISDGINQLTFDAYYSQGKAYTFSYENAPPELTVSVNTASLAEGNSGTTDFLFAVTRTGDTSAASSASYSVTGSGANPADGFDFVSGLPSGIVDFAAGETTKAISIAVAGDTSVESDESFTVTLSDPTNAFIATASANATIQNDDTVAIGTTIDFYSVYDMSAPQIWYGDVTYHDNSKIVIDNGNGRLATYHGSFTYSAAGHLSGGKVTGFEQSENGNPQLSVSNGNFPALTIFNYLANSNPLGLEQYVFSRSDTLNGFEGDDHLMGWIGSDTLRGNAGNDTLDGGPGADTLIGGTGDDFYYVDNILDIVSETDADPVRGGIDEVRSTISYSLVDTDGAGDKGGNVENLTLLGTGAINGIGNELDNVITGNTSANILDGGLGADTLIGGKGNDTYVIDDAGDSIVETSTVTTEIDTVKSYIDFTLGTNLDNLTLLGTAVNGSGNERNNLLIGNDLANLFDGQAGRDTLKGGQGNDTYVVDLIRSGSVAVLQDKVVENTNQGKDTLQLQTVADLGLTVSTRLTLGANLENLDISGTGINKLNLTGNAVDNELIGNDAANMLDGGKGGDSLIGGAGNDTYVVDQLSDIVTENLDEGTDQVNVKIATAGGTYTLGEHVENATLLSTVIYNLVGNDLDNVLIGNRTFNVLTGGAGNDILNGGAGADTLIGGAGDDLYYVDNVLDRISESDADPLTGGNDEVRSTISYSLVDTDGTGTNGGNVENLTLLGTGVINGIGNNLNNIITGNGAKNNLLGNDGNDELYGLGGNDNIDGGKGDDMLVGGSGNDTLTGGAGADIFWYDKPANATTNKDTITDFVSNVDKLQFSLSALSALGTVGQFNDSDDRFLSNDTGVAQAADNHLIYNTDTGALFYDSNGSAAGGSVLIEILAHAPTLVATDIWIV